MTEEVKIRQFSLFRTQSIYDLCN